MVIIMDNFKPIKVSILERRFKQLNNVANFADVSAQAIVMHSKLLNISQREIVYRSMLKAIDSWREIFPILFDNFSKTESLYYATLNENKDSCLLIEKIPTIKKREAPNAFEITDRLYQIGYYKFEGDPFRVKDRQFTEEEIVNNLNSFKEFIERCVLALSHAEYVGIWEPVKQNIDYMAETMPCQTISDFLQLYNQNFTIWQTNMTTTSEKQSFYNRD